MMLTELLRCPVCACPLQTEGRTLRCERGHSFDIAKEGYANLLLSGKPGDSKGDNKEMARSRRDFLNKGYYEPLARAVAGCAEAYTADGDSVLDICCGEGYYTNYLSARLPRAYYGFDISKNMVRLAAKRRCATFFVANIASIPIRDESVRFAFHLFAPFHATEFGRVLQRDGVLLTAIPGKDHLYGLKQALYDTPYRNDEQPPQAEGLTLTDAIRVKSHISLNTPEEIRALFQMTPYCYHTPTSGMQRLEALKALETDIEFVLLLYKK
ncbi:MAG: methyltransferase domain-containing protein [Ruminococcus sp.]|nr:methyltransferase domain-containing protein [Ruminococcus sp.]